MGSLFHAQRNSNRAPAFNGVRLDVSDHLPAPVVRCPNTVEKCVPLPQHQQMKMIKEQMKIVFFFFFGEGSQVVWCEKNNDLFGPSLSALCLPNWWEWKMDKFFISWTPDSVDYFSLGSTTSKIWLGFAPFEQKLIGNAGKRLGVGSLRHRLRNSFVGETLDWVWSQLSLMDRKCLNLSPGC